MTSVDWAGSGEETVPAEGTSTGGSSVDSTDLGAGALVFLRLAAFAFARGFAVGFLTALADFDARFAMNDTD